MRATYLAAAVVLALLSFTPGLWLLAYAALVVLVAGVFELFR